MSLTIFFIALHFFNIFGLIDHEKQLNRVSAYAEVKRDSYKLYKEYMGLFAAANDLDLINKEIKISDFSKTNSVQTIRNQILVTIENIYNITNNLPSKLLELDQVKFYNEYMNNKTLKIGNKFKKGILVPDGLYNTKETASLIISSGIKLLNQNFENVSIEKTKSLKFVYINAFNSGSNSGRILFGDAGRYFTQYILSEKKFNFWFLYFKFFVIVGLGVLFTLILYLSRRRRNFCYQALLSFDTEDVKLVKNYYDKKYNQFLFDKENYLNSASRSSLGNDLQLARQLENDFNSDFLNLKKKPVLEKFEKWKNPVQLLTIVLVLGSLFFVFNLDQYRQQIDNNSQELINMSDSVNSGEALLYFFHNTMRGALSDINLTIRGLPVVTYSLGFWEGRSLNTRNDRVGQVIFF